MSRLFPLFTLALLLAPAPALAQDSLEVAVGGLRGKGMRIKHIARYQKQLKRIEGVKIQSTKGFRKAAKRMGLDGRELHSDPQGLMDTCAKTGTDAVIYGWVERGRRRRDKVLRLRVYSGRDGRMVGQEREVPVPRGRFKRRVWEAAAKAVAADLYAVLDQKNAPIAAPPPADMSFAPVQVDPQPRQRLDDDLGPSGPRGPIILARAGLAMLNRTFEWTPAEGSPVLADGLQYESSLVPGIALDIEAYPLAAFMRNAAQGVGIGVRYEKVFLSTNQIDAMGQEQELETTHQHLLFRLMYRYAFGQEPTSAAIKAHVGFGSLGFEVEDNDDYRGATYAYVDLGLGAYIPLTTPLAALELDLAWLPTVDLGDRTEEVAEEASTSGFRIYAGLASTLPSGLFFSGGLEYTGFSSELSGAGRDGRLGAEASDSYFGLRLMGGYRY